MRSEEEPPTPSPNVEEKRLKFFDSEFVPASKYNPKRATLEDELNQYQKESFNNLYQNVLDYWCENRNKFTRLAKIVRRLFTFQATSVPSERLFSADGYTVWDRRASLSPEKLNKILMIQKFTLT